MREALGAAELFHEQTKVAPHHVGLSAVTLPAPPAEVRGARAPLPLPPVGPRESCGLERAISRRETSRTFAPGATLSRDAFARLLAFSCGQTTSAGGPRPRVTRRAQPSAGATYPLEVYALVRRVAGVAPGVYRYDPRGHGLVPLRPGHSPAALAAWTMGQPYVAGASAVFAVAGFTERVRGRYGARGYRYMLLEAGHVAQNVCLLAADYGLGVVPVGGFIDAAVNRLLGLNDTTQVALYLLAVGVLEGRAGGQAPAAGQESLIRGSRRR